MNFWFLLIYFYFSRESSPEHYVGVHKRLQQSNDIDVDPVQFIPGVPGLSRLTFIRVFRGLGFEYILLRGVEHGGQWD